ncbi:hypothetical protein MGN01_31370 [Methylobacterium gnaphalii]|uniref:Uncharacterized protein n=2 Tax=Methylobacterium gnaphalii TaxID=1010610 RepID=A0A512JMZ3_9HYPH|nr:hypothetical protein MGN01_31370 [Methylobacterium gnaphalii]GLS49992.1 hypothetical protein GCM10007885_28440 [Methylobacterium gnaphalii]
MLDKSLEVDKLLSSHSDSFDKFAQREILNDEYLNAIAQKIFDDGKKISLDQMPGTRNFLGCLVKLALVRIKGAELRHRSDKSLARIKIKSGDFGDLSHSFLPTLRRCILLRSRHGTNNSLNHEKTRKFVLI